MNQYVILTAVGNDRPGLVDEVSQFIFDRGGNIEDSRMVNLRGQFAMMVLVAGSPGTLDRIRNDLDSVRRQTGLNADLRPATAGTHPTLAQRIPYRLTASAMDQAGLVYRFAHLLRASEANIESMETHLKAAPITGAPIFEMEMILSFPRHVPISRIRQELGRMADELNIDWQLSSV